ncbi:MAG: S41 family peptidase, partial [Bacteroidota bacterium]
MKQLLLFLFFTLLICAQCTQETIIERPIILDEMIDIATAKSIRKNQIDWKTFRQQVYDAYDSEGRYGAIGTYLQLLGDNHSFYINGINRTISANNGEVVCAGTSYTFADRPEEIGYVRIDGFIGPSQQGLNFAKAIQNQIQAQDHPRIKGWIVDLSQNTGGNMFPMLAGAHSFFADGEVLGYFIDPDEQITEWGISKGN